MPAACERRSSVYSGVRGAAVSKNQAVRSRSMRSVWLMRPALAGRRCRPMGSDPHGDTECREGSAEAGLRRADRDAEGLGDGRNGHPDVVVEDQDGPLIGAQPPEAAFQLVAVGHQAREIADRRRAHRREFDFDRPSTLPPGNVKAGVDDQTMEPGVEAIWVAQARKVAPGSEVALLDRVARELLVPEDEAGDSLQPRDGRADEHAKGVMIAPPCSLDEFPLVHSHPRDASIRPRSRVMASGRAEPFPACVGHWPRATLRGASESRLART